MEKESRITKKLKPQKNPEKKARRRIYKGKNSHDYSDILTIIGMYFIWNAALLDRTDIFKTVFFLSVVMVRFYSAALEFNC